MILKNTPRLSAFRRNRPADAKAEVTSPEPPDRDQDRNRLRDRTRGQDAPGPETGPRPAAGPAAPDYGSMPLHELLQCFPASSWRPGPSAPAPPCAAMTPAPVPAEGEVSGRPARRLDQRQARASRFTPYGRGRTREDPAVESALDLSTLSGIPYPSLEWTSVLRSRTEAVRAAYRGRSDTKLQALIELALDPRSFVAEAAGLAGAEAENKVCALRLLQASAARLHMSPAAQARDLEAAGSHLTLERRTELAGGDRLKARGLCRMHLYVHYQALSREQRLAAWAALHDPSAFVRDPSQVLDHRCQKSWSEMHVGKTLELYRVMDAAGRRQALLHLLNPSIFLRASRGGDQELAEAARQFKDWGATMSHLVASIRPDLLFTALSTSTPPGDWTASELPMAWLARAAQVEVLSTEKHTVATPALLHRLRTTLTLPAFAPGNSAWEFAAGLRANAMRGLYKTMASDERAREWESLLDARGLAADVDDHYGNAMRQRLDQILAMVGTASGTQADALWSLTWEGRCLPPADAGPQVQEHALALHREALAQLSQQVSPELRGASLERAVADSSTGNPGQDASRPAEGRRLRTLQQAGAEFLRRTPVRPGEAPPTSLRGEYGLVGSVAGVGRDLITLTAGTLQPGVLIQFMPGADLASAGPAADGSSSSSSSRRAEDGALAPSR